MTLPSERRSALKNVNRLFNSIFDAKEWPKVPKAIRQKIIRYGRHYPYDFLIDQMCDAYEACEQELEKRGRFRPKLPPKKCNPLLKYYVNIVNFLKNTMGI